MIRLHVPQPLSAGATVLPTLDQSRYLTQVMRLKTGNALLGFNGIDGEWRCTIAEVLKKGVVLRAEEQGRAQTAVPAVQLQIAVEKKPARDFAIEDDTELAMSRIGRGTTRRSKID